MRLNLILAALAVLSSAITLWQWAVARRFPLHARVANSAYRPRVTILKALKGVDIETRGCLESWFVQEYSEPIQILFGVGSQDDPACSAVRQLIAAHPQLEAALVICGDLLGTNAKVSTLAQLQRHAKHEVIVVSDSDVRVPVDFLASVMAPLGDPAVGLVNCFYCLANPSTLAMQWEAIAINADFWSQVLQARSLKPLDFALGAAVAMRRTWLEAIGGFTALLDYLADDYELGHRIARVGGRIEISPVVVECREAPKDWKQVWAHQVRWARTVRVCKPLPYFFSILGNSTLWPLLWLMASVPSAAVGGSTFPGGHLVPTAGIAFVAFLAVRVLIAVSHQSRLAQSRLNYATFWLVPVKDLLSSVIWALSFLGNQIEWRGQCYQILPGGKLAPAPARESSDSAVNPKKD